MIACCAVLFLAADLDEDLSAAFRAAAARVAPSVVRLEAVGAARPEAALGSAIVAGADGWLFTSAHLARPAPAALFAVLPDGRRLPAAVKGVDRLRGVALLKIAAAGLPVATAAAPPTVGQYAVAVGRGWSAAAPNVATGIVSAVGRIWGRALQTDVKASPANYGGALVDLRGDVLGVLAPLAPDGEGAESGLEWYDSGVAFAVPWRELLPLRPALERGDLRRGLLGVGWRGDDLLAPAVVGRVSWRSPAALAGMRPGDRIMEIDGAATPRLGSVRMALGRTHAGTAVRVVVRRAGRALPFALATVDELPRYRTPVAGAWFAGETTTVKAVAPGTAAAAVLKPGDAILAVAGAAVRNRAEAFAALSERAPKETVELALRRGTAETKAKLELGEFPADPADPAGEAVPAPAPTLVRRVAAVPTPHWLLVPGDLKPDERPGLLVWLDPQAPVAEEWAAACARARLAIVGPVKPEGDPERALALAKAVAERLRAEPLRIAAYGPAKAAEALLNAGAGTVRGAACANGAAGFPANEPDRPWRYVALGDPGDAALAAAVASARERGTPVLDARGTRGAAAAARVAAWNAWLAIW